MSNRMQVTFVNKAGIKNGGRKVIDTWIKDRRHDGFWECDLNLMLKGEARNEDWLTMDENLKACYEYYKDKSADDIIELDEFEVTVEFVMNEDNTKILYAEAL